MDISCLKFKKILNNNLITSLDFLYLIKTIKNESKFNSFANLMILELIFSHDCLSKFPNDVLMILVNKFKTISNRGKNILLSILMIRRNDDFIKLLIDNNLNLNRKILYNDCIVNLGLILIINYGLAKKIIKNKTWDITSHYEAGNILHYCAGSTMLDEDLKILIRKKIKNLNQKNLNQLLNQKNRNNFSPLQESIFMGDSNMIDFLFEFIEKDNQIDNCISFTNKLLLNEVKIYPFNTIVSQDMLNTLLLEFTYYKSHKNLNLLLPLKGKVNKRVKI